MKKVKLLKSLYFLFILSFFGAEAQRTVGYITYWSGSSSSIQFDKLTHINYSFAIPDVDGHLKPLQNTSKLQDIVSRAHKNGVKVLIAVGGYSENGIPLDSRFEAIGANPLYRANLINDIVDLVKNYNLDGADMDWEFPDQGVSADNFESLMSELYTKLHPMGKLVSAAVNPSQYFEGGINPGVKNVVDYLNLMAYDENNSNHSTYQYAIESVQRFQSKGFSNDKLVVGVPFYARPSWSSYSSLLNQGADPYKDYRVTHIVLK